MRHETLVERLGNRGLRGLGKARAAARKVGVERELRDDEERAADIFEREGRGLLPDPWGARDAYIAVISDRSRGITAARALSVVMAIQGIAPVVAPILGGVLVELIGWRGILGVVAAFTGLLVLMVIFWVPESLPSERRHDGGLRILLDGTRELARDHVLM